ncbi:nucleoside triphosphate pyrophosphohydrolase [Lysinibacillus sp. SGAir0095]|uniref:nucleoside triphosphate pyrophosphohydrolase n=1 Tax=Lysinibacillus sp. SGAir0095 TaxID=2070463 RepID=UPI0010CD0E26|nr:nucleoside triphosphate pyrophosphohydrolase [Lysinibacillus sp. SGAir0095]QCR31193.1 phosphoribosyl-ATP pyrophosphohydrolase [Lysinibacillus sp. SGAir0095]
MVIYKKLVRDKIPDIIENSENTCEVATLNQEKFIVELKKKLQEEVTEYLISSTDDHAIEELADILEVVHSLAKTHLSTIEEVEKIRQSKFEERGGFERKFLLVSTGEE